MTGNIISDDSEAEWCDSCDARLFERKDGSRVCSNGLCAREYLPDKVTKHKRKLEPIEGPYDTDEPLFMHLTEYWNYQPGKKKKTSVFDKEDKAMSKKSGFTWTSHEDL